MSCCVLRLISTFILLQSNYNNQCSIENHPITTVLYFVLKLHWLLSYGTTQTFQCHVSNDCTALQK